MNKKIFYKIMLIAIASVLLIFVLSGCNTISLDSQQLMSVPSATGSQMYIQQLIDKSADYKPYTLKYPKRGEYGSAVILHNIDTDDEDEAIAFYKIDDINETAIHMVVMDFIDNEWQLIANESVTASDVDQVQFCNVTNDDTTDILVGYNSYSDSLNQLYVYSYSAPNTLTSQKIDDNYSEVLGNDFDNDGQDEIFITSTDTTSKTYKASLIKMDADTGKLKVIGKTDLNSSISSYMDIKYGKIQDGVYGAFIDSMSDNKTYCTEVVYYDTKENKLVNPLNDSDNNPTLRENDILCSDIDSDGIIEIPTENSLDFYGDIPIDSNYTIDNIIKWNKLNIVSKELDEEKNTIIDVDNGYYINVPKKLSQNIVVLKNKTDDSLNIKMVDDKNGLELKDLCVIKVYNKSQWDMYGGIEGFYEINSKGNNVYTAKISDESNNLGLSIDSIKQNFNFINYY